VRLTLLSLTAALTIGCVNTIPPNPGANRNTIVHDGPNPSDVETDPYTEEEKKLSKGRLGGLWESCYAAYRIKDGAEKDIVRLTDGCAKATGMKAVAPTRTGELSDTGTPARATFVAQPGKCYRVYTTTSSTVTDLDVAVMDPDGRLTVLDRTNDGFPVVPSRGPMCPDRPGVYTVEVTVVKGRGQYALQILSD